MPKAILAMRSYPATLILAVLLFIATLIVTTGSLGKVHNGGDGGDGGSGMGGTGKSGEFGGSGFGGTGGPSPFFTSTDAQDQETTHPDTAPTFELTAPILLVEQAQNEQPTPTNSQESISQRVIEAIESSPLIEETRIEIAQDVQSSENTEVSAPLEATPIQLVELQSPAEQPELDSLQRPETLFEGDAQPEAAQTERQIATAAQAEQENVETENQPLLDEQQIAETIAVKMDTEQQASEQSRDREGLPERIQRPDLPPFQRFQRIERPALMPPRVQPMRI